MATKYEPYNPHAKFARVNATSDGDNTVVPAVAGRKIRVLGFAVTVTAAGTMAVKSDAATTLASYALAANGGVSYAGGAPAPAFETAEGQALVVNCATGQDALGHIVYVEV